MDITIPFLNQVASAGLLGALLVLSLIANWWFLTIIFKQNATILELSRDSIGKLIVLLDALKVGADLQTNYLTQILIKLNGK